MTDATKAWRPILFVMAGTLVLAFGVACFVVPYELVTGGVTGIAIALEHLLPTPFWTVDRIVFVLGWILFFVGWFSFGRGFAAKTLCSSLFYPILLSAFLHARILPLVKGLLDMTGEGTRLLLASLLGGILVGIGCALTLKGGGSTGGTDVLVLIFCRSFPQIGRGKAFFILDSLVILLGFAVLREPMHAVCAVFSALAGATVMDAIL